MRERDGQTKYVLGSMFGWGMLCVCVVSYATNAKGGGRGLGLKETKNDVDGGYIEDGG